jgi:hypothetical protein
VLAELLQAPLTLLLRGLSRVHKRSPMVAHLNDCHNKMIGEKNSFKQ